MRNNLTILVLAQYFFPDIGGGSTRATNIVKGLINNECEVIVVTAFPHYPHGNVPTKYKHKALVVEKFEKAKVFRVWIPALPHSNILNRLILHFCFVISSFSVLFFIGSVDIIWSANPNLFSFFPSYIYSIIKGAPVVKNVDDLWPEVFYELGFVRSKFVQRLLNFLAWFSYTNSSAITPISEGYKQLIVANYRISPDKIYVIEVGVVPVEPLLNDSISKDHFIVMYSGVLGLGYNFDVILRCAKYLENNKNIIFIIRGFGELSKKIDTMIKATNPTNIILQKNILSIKELNTLLNSADVFIIPMASLKFVDLGLPTKIFEFQSHGKPIICISEGEPARYIEYSKSGLVVKHNDSKGLANAVIQLYGDKNLRSELGQNGKKYVLENLTPDKLGKRMLTVFCKVCKKK